MIAINYEIALLFYRRDRIHIPTILLHQPNHIDDLMLITVSTFNSRGYLFVIIRFL